MYILHILSSYRCDQSGMTQLTSDEICHLLHVHLQSHPFKFTTIIFVFASGYVNK